MLLSVFIFFICISTFFNFSSQIFFNFIPSSYNFTDFSKSTSPDSSCSTIDSNFFKHATFNLHSYNDKMIVYITSDIESLLDSIYVLTNAHKGVLKAVSNDNHYGINEDIT